MNNNYSDNGWRLKPEFELDSEDFNMELHDEQLLPENEFETRQAIARPALISLHDTDLNAPCFAGNFNFSFQPNSNRAVATFNTDLSFKSGVAPANRQAIIARLQTAAGYWDSAAALEIKDKHGNFSRRINLGFELKVVQNPEHSNKRTSVHPAGSKAIIIMQKNREVVSLEMHIFDKSTPLAIAHELGHIWGLEDEYKDSGAIGWITMKVSPCHVGIDSPLLNDTNAIMNNGNEFRTRYFRHFGRAIMNSFWTVPDCIIPVTSNGKVVAKTIQGRIRLLKKSVNGGIHNSFTRLNPQFALLQVAKR